MELLEKEIEKFKQEEKLESFEADMRELRSRTSSAFSVSLVPLIKTRSEIELKGTLKDLHKVLLADFRRNHTRRGMPSITGLLCVAKYMG